MSRFVIDVGAMLHLLEQGTEVSDRHQLVAPTLLRSQILDELYTAVRKGEIPEDVARKRNDAFAKMKIRFLGDAKLRRQAWKVAEQLGSSSTFEAEYIALTQLQADAFVTLDENLARAVAGLVETASIDALA